MKMSINFTEHFDDDVIFLKKFDKPGFFEFVMENKNEDCFMNIYNEDIHNKTIEYKGSLIGCLKDIFVNGYEYKYICIYIHMYSNTDGYQLSIILEN